MLISYSIKSLKNDCTINLQYFHPYVFSNFSVSISDSSVGIGISPSLFTTEYDLQLGIMQ